VDNTEELTYLGSVVTTTVGTVDKVKIRVRKANAAFIQLYPVWKAKEILERNENKDIFKKCKLCTTV
jgi:hypothetical protein